MRCLSSLLLSLLLCLQSIIFHPLYSLPSNAIANSSSNPNSISHPYSLAEPDHIQFADIDKLPLSPFKHKKVELITSKDATIGIAAAFPLLSFFLPSGYLVLGMIKLLSSTTGLLKEVDNLNIVTKALTGSKLGALVPYLGIEGIQLLTYFLNADQKVYDHKSKKIRTIRCIDHDTGKRNKGITAIMMRDLVDHFIHEFQKNAQRDTAPDAPKFARASGRMYIKNLDQFLNQWGFVIWSEETVRSIALIPSFSTPGLEEQTLYKKLRSVKILDGDGAMWSDRTSDKVTQKLRSVGIRDEQVIRHILHDLGLLHRLDINVIENQLFKLTFSESTGRTEPTPFSEKVKVNFSQISRNLYEMLKAPHKVRNDIGRALEQAILEGLVSPESLKAFRHKNGGVKFKDKGSDDHLVLLKLALIDELRSTLPSSPESARNAEKIHYISLEEDLLAMQKLIMLVLDEQNINSDLFRIVKINHEIVSLQSIAFVQGIGFTTIGLFRLTGVIVSNILSYKLAEQAALVAQQQAIGPALISQITALTNAMQMISIFTAGFTAGTGVLTFTLATYQFIQFFAKLVHLENSKNVIDLLDRHLEELSLKSDSATNLNVQGHRSLEVTRFNIAADYFLMKQEQKSLIISLELRSIWIAFGAVAIASGTVALLFLLGVTALASTVTGFGIAVPIFIAAVTLPVMYLLDREFNLQKKVAMIKQAISELKGTFDLHDDKNGEKEVRQNEYLKLFLQDVEEMITLYTKNYEIKDNQKMLSKQKSVDDIETTLVELYATRKNAIKHWKKMCSKSPKVKNEAEALILKDLQGKGVPLNPLVLEPQNLYATTFRSGVDVIIENLDPTLSGSHTAKLLYDFPLPATIDTFYEDIHLSKLFSVSYLIYSNVMKNRAEGLMLRNKKEIQERYFGVSLSHHEIHMMEKRHHRREHRNDDLLKDYNLNEEVACLEELHPDIPETAIIPWKYEIVDQLQDLIAFDKSQSNFLTKPESEEDKIPDHSLISLLVSYFLPLSPVDQNP